MRIFVFEYITGGGCVNEEMIPSLKAEGDMMLNALVRDLTELESIDVLISRDVRLDSISLPTSIHWVEDAGGAPGLPVSMKSMRCCPLRRKPTASWSRCVVPLKRLENCCSIAVPRRCL